MEQLDIVKLIEDNPITKLSNDYNIKLLTKIKEKFTDFEQQLFLSSFYCYLNCNPINDFVVDLDNIWKWLGFSQKIRSKELLEKNFKINNDYKILLSLSGEQNFSPASSGVKKDNRGGHNKEIIMLNIKCFKLLCLKAQTKKADEIHEYYIKLEQILQETIDEECNELKLQLQNKDKLINQKQKEVEQALISQFPVNTECIYFGIIDDTNEDGEKLIKFGHTNDLSNRVSYHHKHYSNFFLKNAFRVQNKVEIENLIKNHPKIKSQLRTIKINEKNKTEIIAYNDSFTIDKLTKIIKEIIQSKIYSIENFNKLTKRNEELESVNNLSIEKILFLEKNNLEQIIEINNLREKLDKQQKIIDSTKINEESVYQNILLPEDEINKKFNNFVNEICIVRPDVQELSVNLEGRYRLWSKVKPTKEIFHALKNYLDTRFKPKRIDGNHGYAGIKLKSIEYKKTSNNSDVENFIFNSCEFSDCGKILNSTLLREYQKWKASVNKELTDNDMKEIKIYLNESPYTLKGTVWTDGESNEGYYGISLKQPYIQKEKISSSTGKKVYKREKDTNELLATWDTIAKAAEMEGFCSAKMSRYIKNKNIINDYYYSVI
jgi:hypothetical protein